MTFLHLEANTAGWEKNSDFNIHQDSSPLPLTKEKLAILPLLLIQASYYSVGKEESPQEDLLHQFSERMKVSLELNTSLYWLSWRNLDLLRCIYGSERLFTSRQVKFAFIYQGHALALWTQYAQWEASQVNMKLEMNVFRLSRLCLC